jgi:hypothetical protein
MEKMSFMKIVNNKNSVDAIFDLAEQGVLSEDKAFSILMDEKPIHLAKKMPRKLGKDNSRQHD